MRSLLALFVSIALCWPSVALAGRLGPTAPAADTEPDAEASKPKPKSKSKSKSKSTAESGKQTNGAEPQTLDEAASKPDAEPVAEEPAAEGSEAGSEQAEPMPVTAAPASVDEAIEAGDLATAAELAREARQADPTPANWHAEGRVLEMMGDYEGAARAYQAEMKVLPEDAEAARRAARADLDRVRKASRGTVEGEPASQHRDELDERWAPKTPPPKPEPKKVALTDDEPKDDERIIRKWYFWVTVIAIAASAAAVTGIAIKASRDERDDALGLTRMPGGMQGPAVFRF